MNKELAKLTIKKLEKENLQETVKEKLYYSSFKEFKDFFSMTTQSEKLEHNFWWVVKLTSAVLENHYQEKRNIPDISALKIINEEEQKWKIKNLSISI